MTDESLLAKLPPPPHYHGTCQRCGSLVSLVKTTVHYAVPTDRNEYGVRSYISCKYQCECRRSNVVVEYVYQEQGYGWVIPPSTTTGPCFIATAAYGTPMAAELDYLRWYRDAVLLKHALGKAFVRCYYRTSPPIADFIRGHDSLRAITRLWLNPVVARCKALKASMSR